MRLYCPYCPRSARCLVEGMEPFTTHVGWQDKAKKTKKVPVHCEPWRPPPAPGGFRPKATIFMVPVEVLGKAL